MNPDESRSIKSLLSDLAHDVTTLFRQELRLAQAEGEEKITKATTGLIAIVAGLLVATCGLLILLQALVLALAVYMPAWLASLIVGLSLAVIAFIAIRMGQSSLSADKLTPRRTLRSVRETTDVVMEKAR